MKTTASRVSQRCWVLLSVCGSLGCDRAVDLGAYIGGHARSTPSSSPSSASAVVVQPEALLPAAAASTTAIASAAPIHSSAASSAAPPGRGEQRGNVRGADESLERAASHRSTGQAPAAAVSAKPTVASTPSPPAQKTGVVRNASVGGASVFGGNVSNAARVIAGLRAAMRGCYASNPSSSDGELRLTLVLSPTGAVTRVSSTRSPGSHGGPGPSERVVACATSAVQHAQFEPPETGKATIAFPVTFSEQEAVPPRRTSL